MSAALGATAAAATIDTALAIRQRPGATAPAAAKARGATAKIALCLHRTPTSIQPNAQYGRALRSATTQASSAAAINTSFQSVTAMDHTGGATRNKAKSPRAAAARGGATSRARSAMPPEITSNWASSTGQGDPNKR